MTDRNSNQPKVLVEFSPEEAAWLMDILHDDWHRRIAMEIATHGFDNDHNAHVIRWKKHRASMFLNRIDKRASDQGFGDL